MRGRRSSPGSSSQALSYTECPAKTWQARKDEEIRLGRLVLEHCVIVGTVARQLIDLYPPQLAEKLFPAGSPLVAAAHDVGKVSPTFVAKLARGCTHAPSISACVSDASPDLESQWGGHAGVSQLAAQAINLPRFIPEILGQHHGFTPPVATYQADDSAFGGAAWQQERQKLFDELRSRLGMEWPDIKSDAQARLLAGLTSVADWIGSGHWFENPAIPWQPNIQKALDEAGWHLPSYQSGLSFEDVFGFSPRSAQQQLINAVQGPGVYVLEAPMGLGKTEAALYAAYCQLEAGQASGIYFALPTQLTSNKIYDRFNQFLRQVLSEDSPLHSRLLHSGAWLVDTSMGEEGEPGRAWFSSSKRGLLAPFAVGTLDQALMAAMNVKHGFVRAFGLAGKVVILDEVHTYDAYTSTLLDALITLLRQLECTVIILSATLNQSRRIQLLKTPLQSQDYPLITALPNSLPKNSEPQELSVAAESQGIVKINRVKDIDEAIEEALRRAELGQQVLWIENTVAEAQEHYETLAARAQEIGVACGLLHSRFTPQHRQTREEHWVNLFGKPGWKDRHKQGRILVGTQVLEQSLDIDADFLVSRFAPTDMLLQRLGRLWRHKTTPRHPSAQQECWLVAPALDTAIATPHVAFGKTASVYAPYVLCRSLEVWEHTLTVALPEDIRPLIEATYKEREEAEPMTRWLRELDEGVPGRKGRRALARLAQIGLAKGGQTLSDTEAQTRYSELDTLEVLLLRHIEPLKGGGCTLTLLDGSRLTVPSARHQLEKPEWRALSVSLMKQVVKVTPNNAPVATTLNTLQKLGLHHCFYLGSQTQDEARLRVALVTDDENLQGLYGSKAHDSKTLEYRDDLGYRVR